MSNTRAILLCAGIGRRMLPILDCNKGLLPVGGYDSNVSHLVDLLVSKGITDIIIVTNSLAADEYTDLVKNCFPEYAKVVVIKEYTRGCNNEVTMRAICDYIGDSYIIEADQFIEDSSIFSSNNPPDKSYLYTYKRGPEDWSVYSDLNGRVEYINTRNPEDTYCLGGVIYLCQRDSNILRDSLRSSNSIHKYWESYLDPSRMNLYQVKCSKYSIEYDNIEELLQSKLMTTEEVARLIDEECKPERLNSMTNDTFLITWGGDKKVLRLPGLGTEDFVDHERESKVESIVQEECPGISPRSIFFSAHKGVKITDYLEGYHIFGEEKDDFSFILRALDEIHRITKVGNPSYVNVDLFINLIEELEIYEQMSEVIAPYGRVYSVVRDFVVDYLKNHLCDYELCIIHRDLVPENILVKNCGDSDVYYRVDLLNSDLPDVQFIDWEYSGILTKYWDYASLILEYADRYSQPVSAIQREFLRCHPHPAELNREAIEIWMIIVDFIWAAWSLAKCASGDDVYEYGKRRITRAYDNLVSLTEP